jgi:acetolactate synthase-1/3 small subunit
MQNLLKNVGILELARTGVVALERGESTLVDETKENKEFNLGKNMN